MNEVRTGQASLTIQDALVHLRGSAMRDPGQWKRAESERESLQLEWLAGSNELDTPEVLRVTRRFVAPVAEDLERVAAALPVDVEIGPILPEYAQRRFSLGLRPKTQRAPAERCPCGASPRFGTRLYGDQQVCAICALWREAPPS